MNCIFVIALSALFVALTVSGSLDQSHVESCAKELNLTEDEILRIHPDAADNPTGNLKCVLKCLLEKLDFVKDGVIQPTWYKQLNDEYDIDTVKNFVNKCSSIEAEGKCEMAIKFVMCNDKILDEIRMKEKQK